MKKETIKITKNTDILSTLTEFGFSYNYANKLLRNKDVRIFNDKVKENLPLSAGDEITFFYDDDAIVNAQKFKEVYQDEHIIVVDKYAGIEIEGDLDKQLSAYAVHRLDRNTTGLVILAKDHLAQNSLLQAFKNHTIEKKYYAEVVGKTSFKNFTHKAYLLKDAKASRVKIFDHSVKGAVEIITIFNSISSNPSSSIVECTLITGKTHQIRASLAYLGHPIIGDGKYGKNEDNKKFKEKNQRLHSATLTLKGLTAPLEYLNGTTFKSKPQWKK